MERRRWSWNTMLSWLRRLRKCSRRGPGEKRRWLWIGDENRGKVGGVSCQEENTYETEVKLKREFSENLG